MWLIIAKIVSINVVVEFFLYNNPIGCPTNCDRSLVSFCDNTFFFSILIRWAGQPIPSKPSTFPSLRVKIQTTNLHYPSSYWLVSFQLFLVSTVSKSYLKFSKSQPLNTSSYHNLFPHKNYCKQNKHTLRFAYHKNLHKLLWIAIAFLVSFHQNHQWCLCSAPLMLSARNWVSRWVIAQSLWVQWRTMMEKGILILLHHRVKLAKPPSNNLGVSRGIRGSHLSLMVSTVLKPLYLIRDFLS